MTTIELPTSEGCFKATFTARGLANLEFPPARVPRAGVRRRLAAPLGVPRRWLEQTRRAIDAVLRGRPGSSLPPLDLSSGTDFQRSVWRELQSIPPGHTRTYGQIAAVLGRPQAARAVGQACGANPIPLLIPCHRVLAAGHRLGGFSGGLDWKRRLLGREGHWVDVSVVRPGPSR